MEARQILESIARFAELTFRGPLFIVWMQDNVLCIHQGSRDERGYFASVHPHDGGGQVQLMARTESLGRRLEAMLSPEDCIRALGRLAAVA